MNFTICKCIKYLIKILRLGHRDQIQILPVCSLHYDKKTEPYSIYLLKEVQALWELLYMISSIIVVPVERTKIVWLFPYGIVRNSPLGETRRSIYTCTSITVELICNQTWPRPLAIINTYFPVSWVQFSRLVSAGTTKRLTSERTPTIYLCMPCIRG